MSSNLTETATGRKTDLYLIAKNADYLIAELRCASLRARLWQADIDAVGLALKGGMISPEQALGFLADCGALHLVGVREEAEA
jgi:hypothetical protein